MGKPTENEINDVLNECASHEDDGTSKYPGMTYDQGVSTAVRWMLGEEEASPME